VIPDVKDEPRAQQPEPRFKLQRYLNIPYVQWKEVWNLNIVNMNEIVYIVNTERKY